jgi:hypothetical protein
MQTSAHSTAALWHEDCQLKSALLAQTHPLARQPSETNVSGHNYAQTSLATQPTGINVPFCSPPSGIHVPCYTIH